MKIIPYSRSSLSIEETISKNISYLRKKKGLTQEDLGNDLNYTFQAVSRWETGKSLPSAVTLKRIADYFDVPIEYLYTEHSETVSAETDTKLKKKEIVQKIVLVAVLVFSVFGLSGMIIGMLKLNGLTGFLWASAALLFLALAFTMLFKKKKLQLISASLLLWDIANCIFYQFDNGTNSLYMVFFYAMFGQIFLILLWVFLKKR